MRRSGPLTAISLVFVWHTLLTNMTKPFVPLYAASLDVGYLGVGVVAAAAGFLPIFFAVPVGSLTDRWGVRPMAATGALLNVVGFSALTLFPSLATIIAAQLIAGVAHLLVVLSSQTFVGTLGKGRAAERNFGTFTVFASIGQIGGPLLGGLLIGVGGFRAAFAVAVVLAIMCFLSATLVLPRTVRNEAPRPAHAAPRRALQYLGDRGTQLAILASCLMSVPEVLRTSFLPVYLGDAVGLKVALVGYVLAIFSVAGLVAKSVLPRVVGRFGRYPMLFGFTVGCALTLLALPLTGSLWVAAVVTGCMGLTFGLGRPLSMAMAANAAKPGEEGFVVALRLSGNRAAEFVLPVVFGSAASLAGIGAVFFVGAGLLLAGSGALIGPLITELRSRRG